MTYNLPNMSSPPNMFVISTIVSTYFQFRKLQNKYVSERLKIVRDESMCKK